MQAHILQVFYTKVDELHSCKISKFVINECDNKFDEYKFDILYQSLL